MSKSYEEFLEGKRFDFVPTGFEPVDVNPMLFDWQKDVVKWACRKGRACLFEECGCGKTIQQLEWARQVCENASGGGGTVLIVAPLAVSGQTVREGNKFGISVNRCKEASDLKQGINITNYERLEKFDGIAFDGVVLDESSILKSFTGKTRNRIIDMFADTPYKLACTATPSPNDYTELGNHCELMGCMSRTEMLAMFFVHDGGDTSKWRLKGHAHDAFWDFVSTWAVTITKPSDIGYPDDGFNLPPLNIHQVVVETPQEDNKDDTRLFAVEAVSLTDQLAARRSTMELKADYIAQKVNSDDAQYIIWCNLNAESDYLEKAIPDAVAVKGSDTDEHKEKAMLGFADGNVRVLVTKPSIAGFGMNWQCASHMVFCGLSNSYEAFYQAVRREWRYGQTNSVEVDVVVSDQETAIVRNVLSKRDAMENMQNEMTKRSHRIREDMAATQRDELNYAVADESGDGWKMMLGDCVQRIKEIPDDSIGYSIFSPPFISLYSYSNSVFDMSNCASDDEFMDHFRFLVADLYRVIQPGRLLTFHCQNVPMMKERDGQIGLKDFRGDLIRMFQEAGFIYHSEVCIWKDPVTEMQRTKALGLLNKQKNKNAAMSRQGLPDYLVTMRKPGDAVIPVTHDNDSFPVEEWQKYASPVWMDINQSDTLQYRSARDNNDERHICPMNISEIRRCIKLWSVPGVDTVLSPFGGIGSEGYVAVKEGRKFIGIELKPSYFNCAVNNLKTAEREASQRTLFDFMDASE